MYTVYLFCYGNLSSTIKLQPESTFDSREAMVLPDYHVFLMANNKCHPLRQRSHGITTLMSYGMNIKFHICHKSDSFISWHKEYRQTCNISRPWVDNEIVDHPDVVGA